MPPSGGANLAVSASVTAMERMRVLFGDIPENVKKQIQDAICAEGDVQIVGQAEGPFQMLFHAGKSNADVVIVSLPDSGCEPGIVSHILSEYPHVVVLGVSKSLSRMALYRHVVQCDEIPQTTSGLCTVLREAVAAQVR